MPHSKPLKGGVIVRIFVVITLLGMLSLAKTLLSGVGVGIATSATWAITVYGFNWCRNLNIERQIRKSLRPSGPGISMGRNVDVTIHNTTSVPVTVRSFCLKCGEGGDYTVSFGLNKDRSPDGTEANSRGWVVLPVQTEATWSFPADFPNQEVPQGFTEKFLPVVAARAVVEYTTIFGTTKVIEVDGERPSDFDALIQGEFAKLFPPTRPTT